jgi:hypothetical protein
MVNRLVQTAISAILAGNLAGLPAATPIIGVVSASGGFSMNNASVRDNATVPEGSTIETEKTSSVLHLLGGTRVELGLLSRGRVYRDRLMLEKGVADVKGSNPFRVEALSLRIAPSHRDGFGRVAFVNEGTIEVAAVSGGLRVTSAEGVVIADLAPGMALAFRPQAEATARNTTLTGCLKKIENRYLLTDETSNVVFEVQGFDAARMAGHRVQVSGSTVADATPAAGANQVVKSISVISLAASCSVDSPVGGADRSGAAAAGMSGKTKVIIAGVAIAGAGVGLGIGLSRRGQCDKPDNGTCGGTCEVGNSGKSGHCVADSTGSGNPKCACQLDTISR